MYVTYFHTVPIADDLFKVPSTHLDRSTLYLHYTAYQ